MIELDGGMPRIKSFLFLGDASYAIYLFHGLPIILTSAVGAHFGLQGLMQVVVLSVISLTASIAGFVIIDRPLNNWLMVKKG